MVAPAVLVEFLAVIRGHHDDGIGPFFLHIRDHPAHHGVAIRDLTVVAINVAAAEIVTLVHLIGYVGLEQVQPEEDSARILFAEEIVDLFDPLLGVPVFVFHVFEVEVVGLESLHLLRIDKEHRRRKKCGGLPTVAAQGERQGFVLALRGQPRQGRVVLAGH